MSCNACMVFGWCQKCCKCACLGDWPADGGDPKRGSLNPSGDGGGGGFTCE